MCKDVHQKMILNPSNLQDHVVQKIIEYLEDPELVALKKRLEEEKLEKLKYLKKKEKKVEEWNGHFEEHHSDEYLPLIEEYPDKCRKCNSLDLYENAYTDDIDIVCGKCNQTAVYLPGYDYDPVNCKKLKAKEITKIKKKRMQFYYTPWRFFLW